MKKFLFGFMAVAAVLLTVAFTFSSCKEETVEVKGAYGEFRFEISDSKELNDNTKAAILNALNSTTTEINKNKLPIAQAEVAMDALLPTIKEVLKAGATEDDPTCFTVNFILKNTLTGKDVKTRSWRYEDGVVKDLY
ncbi:MAG: hypothetical protein HUK04_05420 [Bacteroidaceae bacterium]|nr:hypothetical protein [Bacteroidaceae bacterium]